MNTKKPMFYKGLYSLCFIIFLAVSLFIRAEKPKSKFLKTTGKLISISNSNDSAPREDTLKNRYLKIDSYPKTFEIFIGKDDGDFKPKYEKIDSLKLNENICIYFDENDYTKEDSINRLVYFIDRGNEPILIKGAWEKSASFFLAGLSILIFIILIILKKSCKIC